MKFFLPAATDDAMAEEVLAGIKKFAQENLSWESGAARIYRISYVHDGKGYISEVGKPDGRIGETVIAILDSATYLVCTANRGVLRGEPVLVGKNEVKEIEYFEGFEGGPGR